MRPCVLQENNDVCFRNSQRMVPERCNTWYSVIIIKRYLHKTLKIFKQSGTHDIGLFKHQNLFAIFLKERSQNVTFRDIFRGYLQNKSTYQTVKDE